MAQGCSCYPESVAEVAQRPLPLGVVGEGSTQARDVGRLLQLEEAVDHAGHRLATGVLGGDEPVPGQHRGDDFAVGEVELGDPLGCRPQAEASDCRWSGAGDTRQREGDGDRQSETERGQVRRWRTRR